MRITLPSGTTAELRDPAEAPRGLVVIPDIGGLRPLFDDLVAQLADQTGWAVCAVEIFPDLEDKPLDWRLANGGAVPDTRRLADLVEAADATGCATVSILGFCMGGMMTMKATRTGRFHRAVAFYGMVHTPENWTTEGNVDPLGAVSSADACPVMMIAGTADQWTPSDDLDALEAAGATVIRYEGAEHGFVHDPSRPAHRAADAADAWSRVHAFLAE